MFRTNVEWKLKMTYEPFFCNAEKQSVLNIWGLWSDGAGQRVHSSRLSSTVWFTATPLINHLSAADPHVNHEQGPGHTKLMSTTDFNPRYAPQNVNTIQHVSQECEVWLHTKQQHRKRERAGRRHGRRRSGRFLRDVSQHWLVRTNYKVSSWSMFDRVKGQLYTQVSFTFKLMINNVMWTEVIHSFPAELNR